MKRFENEKLNYWLKLGGIVLIACLSFYLIFYQIFPVLKIVLDAILTALCPFLLGLLIAILIDPIVLLLTKRLHFKRGWAVLITLLFFIAVIGLLLGALISWIVVEITRLSQSLPDMGQYVNLLIDRINLAYNNLLNSSWDSEVLRDWLDAQSTRLADWGSVFLNSLLSVLMGTPGALLVVLVSLLAAFFISKEKDAIIAKLIKWFFPKKQEYAKRVYIDTVNALMGFLRAQILVMLIIAMITVAGLYILGTKYALSLGLLIALVDALPILGPGLIMIPWIIVMFIMGNYGMAIGLLIIYAIISVMHQVLQPKIMADSMHLHPLLVLAAMYVGLQLLGVWGLILGPVILVVFKSIRDARKKYKG